MYKDKNIGAVILARRMSTRLKDKMLLDLGGKTVIANVIERIGKSRLIDSFILATSTNKEDDVFEDIAKENNIEFFRGSEDDVAGRIFLASGKMDPRPDVVVKVCSDNPLLMPTVVDEAVKELVDTESDVITPFEFNTYPFGYSMVVMTASCVWKINSEAKEKTYREHVENYCFEYPDRFRVRYQKAPETLDFPALNLTLDYEEDYQRIKGLLQSLDKTPIDTQPEHLINAVKCSVAMITCEGSKILLPEGRVSCEACESQKEARYCLMYNKTPIFIDHKSTVSIESEEEFVSRIFPLVKDRLGARPPRPVSSEEIFYPKKEKKGSGKRAGFLSPEGVSAPERLLVEMINNEGIEIDKELLNKLVLDIKRIPLKHVIIGLANDPKRHSQYKEFIKNMAEIMGENNITVSPDGTFDKNMPIEEAVFRRIVLWQDGSLGFDAKVQKEDSIIGSYSEMSIAQAWQSMKARRLRVDILNSERVYAGRE